MKPPIFRIAAAGVKAAFTPGGDVARMIDPDRIAELNAEIGAEDLGLVIAVYFAEAIETIDRLSGDLSPEDRIRALHFLRSGALNIGLRGLARKVAPLEEGARAGEMATLAHELRGLLERSRAEMAGFGIAA